MKVLLYFEGENLISKSGIGRAMRHQMEALRLAQVEVTTDPKDDYDILHINTVGFSSPLIINQARKLNKKVIYHAHSTEEDFKNSFILSNQIAPLYRLHLINLYSSADFIITPTPYSLELLKNYGITVPMAAISNGVDVEKYQKDDEKAKAFYRYFHLSPKDKIVMAAGLYLKRKGIIEFMEVARLLPEVTFIWFGHTSKIALTKDVKMAIENHPMNVRLPGYVKGAIFEGAFANADVFFFPSFEETEGIVVLEALAAKQEVVVRDIGVYKEWLVSGENCYKGNSIDEFAHIILNIINKKVPSVGAAGYQTAEKRTLAIVGQQLKAIYQQVLNMPD